MSTARESDQRLHEWAQEREESYKPNSDVRAAIAQKTIVLLIGPTGVGKSYVSQHLNELDPRFSELGTISTRERRAEDPDYYRTGVSAEEFTQRIEAGELVQFHHHPHTGELYGSDLASHQTDYIVAPALAGSVEKFQQTGYGRVIPVGLVAPANQWMDQLESRKNDDDYRERLKEAVEVVEWLRAHKDNVPILINNDGRAKKTAQELVDITDIDDQVFNRLTTIGEILHEMNIEAHKELGSE